MCVTEWVRKVGNGLDPRQLLPFSQLLKTYSLTNYKGVLWAPVFHSSSMTFMIYTLMKNNEFFL